jgi:putative tricarboxylic transport membrane protein
LFSVTEYFWLYLMGPIILLFCSVGACAVNGSSFEIAFMIAFGLLGVVCERWKISIGTLVLGWILGGPWEERFVQTLAGGQGGLAAFIDRPLAALLAVACLLLWISVAIGIVKQNRKPTR